jgi:hypothetical protein
MVYEVEDLAKREMREYFRATQAIIQAAAEFRFSKNSAERIRVSQSRYYHVFVGIQQIRHSCITFRKKNRGSKLRSLFAPLLNATPQIN